MQALLAGAFGQLMLLGSGVRHDLAHYANAASSSPRRRSLFLSDSGIHPLPTQGKAVFDLLGKAPIGQGSASTHSVASRIEALVGPLPSDTSRLPRELWATFGMPSQFKAGNETSPDQRKTARHACHLLALDLVLASNVYTSQRPVPPPELDPDDELERATQALSLYGDDGGKKAALPPHHFSFFRPVLRGSDRKGKGRASDDVGDGAVTGSATARSLMSTWLVGEDPGEHRHVDLHGADHQRAPRLEISSAAAASAFTAGRGAAPNNASQSQSQPPTISITPAAPPLPTFSQTGRRLQAPALQMTQPSALSSFRLFGAGAGEDSNGGSGGGGGSLPPLRTHDSLPSFARATESSQARPTFSSQEYNDFGPQTQIMPGAHGGRPGAGGAGGAKKAKKKRIGGF